MVDLIKMLDEAGPEARLRVDTKYGYISYGAQDWEKALNAFAESGIRLRLQKNIFDDGKTILGNALTNEVAHGVC